ncbi:MAG: hypothetical protein PHI96_02170 [Desulfovibrio sp.]|nr:hypothetical protein [Desulfovibrio sp.]
MSVISKDVLKVIRTCLQIGVLLALALFVGRLFMERGEPPLFDREQWTARDGFTAISYGSVTRQDTPGLNSRRQLAEHVSALTDAGYNWVTTEDIFNFYNNNGPLPEKALYLMFEGGRKDSVIFGQDVIGPASAHASLFTNTDTLSGWNNFFVTFSNVASLSKSPFWDVGSQGVRLMRINEGIPGWEENYFLNDFLRNDQGLKIESEAEMRARLADYYEKSFAPLASSMRTPPQAYIYMPANSFNAFMPEEVEKANRQLMAQYFPLSFTREGPALNSFAEGPQNLTRLQVPSDWDADTLLKTLEKWSANREEFVLQSSENVEDWSTFHTKISATPFELILNPQQDSTDPALLRGSSVWDNVRLSLRLELEEQGERHIYLRYTSRDSYIRLTVQYNRLVVAERLPGQGVFTIYDKVLSKPPPWDIDIQLMGNRLGISLNGERIESGLLPVSAPLRKGYVALGATTEARFGKLSARRLPTTWRLETAEWTPPVKGEKPAPSPVWESSAAAHDGANAVTAVALSLPEKNTSSKDQLAYMGQRVLAVRAQGSMPIAALPPGKLDFNDAVLNIPPFSTAQSLKLWDGVMLTPEPQADWAQVEQALQLIERSGLQPVLRLSLEAAKNLATSGKRMSADYFMLDFQRDDMPPNLWTSFAHRHNRNTFLQEQKTPEGQSPVYSIRSH